MSSESAPSPEGPSPAPKRFSRRHVLALLPVALGVLVGLVFIGVVVFLAVRSLLFPPSLAGIPLEVTRVFDSPPATPPPQVSPPSAPPVVQVGDVEVSLPPPVSLEAGDRAFTVHITSQEGGVTDIVPPVEPGVVAWVDGTIVNYVMLLGSTEENLAWFQGLQAGDAILLRLSNGTRLTFRVRERQEAAPDQVESFLQSYPGLTLFLPRQEQSWLVLTSDFESAVEVTPPAGEGTSSVGETVQVGDARVTVLEGGIVQGEQLQPGTILYVVEFSLQNTGQDPLDPSDFLMQLVDSLENRYLLSANASAAGQYGLLTQPIAPGQELNGSAGYVVPNTLSGPNLIWVFSPQAGSELRARFAIPYRPQAGELSFPEVDIFDAFLGEEGENLHIMAEIYNAGDAPLVVNEEDISLSSSAGPVALENTAPPLPWTIAGGDAREVELVFPVPDASAAVVTLLGYTFEISGLP